MDKRLQLLGQLGVIPVVTINRVEDAPKLGRALLAGGLPTVEITLRTTAAPEAIRALTAEFPDLLVGAGTVLSIKQAEQAVMNGAQYIVAPGFDAELVDWCLANGVPVTPGVLTPTEVGLALQKGLTVLKFFPAEAAGGLILLKALAGPFAGVRFIPTGGINARNLGKYLSLPVVHACGGSWMASKELIENDQFPQITALAREAVAIAVRSREERE